jgi:hypothetical protein
MIVVNNTPTILYVFLWPEISSKNGYEKFVRKSLTELEIHKIDSW